MSIAGSYLKNQLITCLLGFLLFFSCTNIEETGKEAGQILIEVADFQSILDSAKLSGIILIYDFSDTLYYSNDFADWQVGSLPASTFKIPNSIIALETGVIKNVDHEFRWNGEPRLLSSWERDMNLTQAFHLSCVPCYQEIARKVGDERMTDLLVKMDYGSMFIDDSTIDLFWLEGKSTISPLQQVDFLERLHHNKLPISEGAVSTVLDMMVLESKPNYILRGKTGWSIRDGNNTGWFVGSLEQKGKTYFFATRIEPTDLFDMDRFPRIRKVVTMSALQKLNLIE